MEFTEYIDQTLLVLVPVLYIIGTMLKKGGKCDRHIPWMLGVTGVLLAVIWVLATHGIGSYQDALMAAFTAFVQGILCTGAAVYAHQLLKQNGRDD
jgi:hypothetical protein